MTRALSSYLAVGSKAVSLANPPCWHLELSASIPHASSHPTQMTFIYSLAWDRGEN